MQESQPQKRYPEYIFVKSGEGVKPSVSLQIDGEEGKFRILLRS